MATKMSSCLILSLVLGTLMTSLCPVTNGLPRLITRQPSRPYFLEKQMNDGVCMNYMERCVPWETKCCNNMDCMNLARGFCLYPLERCLCQQA